MDIILPFVHCFYPANAAQSKKVFQQSYRAKEMGPIARTPGQFAVIWKAHHQQLEFDPP
jgi:hypothetical protein